MIGSASPIEDLLSRVYKTSRQTDEFDAVILRRPARRFPSCQYS